MSNFRSDFIINDPSFNSTETINDITLLEPVTRELVQKIIEDAEAQGLKLMIFETFRSQGRQEILFQQGATKLRNVGVHNFGLACDIVKDIDGEPSWKGDFSLLGDIAHHYGLIWGGDWGAPDRHHSFIDVYHVQRCSLSKQASLFQGDWYPDDDYNPYDD